MYEGAVQDLIDELGRLPGVGPKSAQRIAFHLLAADPADVRRLVTALTEVKARVRFCEVCGNVSQEPQCRVCRDPRRVDDVLGLLDDADRGRRAAGVTAHPALRLLRDVAADLAEPDARLDLGQRDDQPPHVRGVRGEHVERDPLRALGTDAGQPPELVDQVLDRTLVHTPTLRAPRPPGPGARRPPSVAASHGRRCGRCRGPPNVDEFPRRARSTATPLLPATSCEAP